MVVWLRGCVRVIQKCGRPCGIHRPAASAAACFSSRPTLLESAPLPSTVPLSRLTDSFLNGSNSVYLEELQRAWEADPSSVDESWDTFFQNYRASSRSRVAESTGMLRLLQAYQVNGHKKAKLDPLGLQERVPPRELDPALYGLSDEETVRASLERLEHAYCGSIGYEYMHIPDRDKCNWLRERIDQYEPVKCPREKQTVILDRLMWSTKFEGFLKHKWPATKRFGLEGCETLIPGMKGLIDRVADLGVESIVIGMPHRGRLNVLGNVVKKSLRNIFNEFSHSGKDKAADVVQRGYTGTGDVKYHLGTSYDRTTRSGKKIHLSLVANPSHLEAVDPVVIGKTRAKQHYSNDKDRSKNMAILIHGDGSFSGQGVVYETFHLSDLPNYTTGGTIHIVVNNQVAFTTDPKSSRSSPYCTDVAKALNAPIFHVNGDDVEAVVHACELAAEWRMKFKSDVVVDIVCYRRHGHNEVDEPSFTQPKMYEVINKHPNPLQIYEDKLMKSGEISTDDITKLNDKVMSILNEEYEQAKIYFPKKQDWLSAYWTGFKSPEQLSRLRNTGVEPEILKSVGRAITQLPATFSPHKSIKKNFEQRAEMIKTGEGLDWAMGEALAFGTLLAEGYHVRLSGQDVERGTFSHRHAVLHDQKTGEKFCPLDHVVTNQPDELFTVSNSSLSEFGVLGFELGYSMEHPNSLVCWEAQFGDFANGAQVIFDQFLSSGEAKWLRQTGLVVMLPHGYDGQGPEHSSARLERFLQMSQDNPFVIPEMDVSLRKQIQECNWQVVNVTTPANYFHVLRRQMQREFRKPLIVMSPKNLLRSKDCRSNLSEFDDAEGHPGSDKQGTRFKRLIKDKNDHGSVEEGIRRLILCSGKVYYALDQEREKLQAKDVAICRVEQLCPVPYDLFQRELKRYPNAEVVWCQEEPMNMGAFSYMLPRLGTAMASVARGGIDDVKYVGRAPSAATATGFSELHEKEAMEISRKVFQLSPIAKNIDYKQQR